MIPEPYLGLLIGAILTIVVTVISTFLRYNISEKQWFRQKESEEWKEAIQNIYSPLIFDLSDVIFQLGIFNGQLNNVLKNDISNRNIQERFVKWLQDFKKEDLPSSIIKNILRTKLGMIRPIELQQDLYLVTLSLANFENDIFIIDKITFEKEDIKNIEKKFQNYRKITTYYFAVFNHIALSLEKILEKEELSSEFKYKKVYNTSLALKIRKLSIESNNTKLYTEINEDIDEALKEIKVE